ncbi:MAG: hypothetical protein ABSE51_20415 [Terracidiphilus sp.]|jgi:hypothetical protein
MDTYYANYQAVNTRDNKAGPIFSSDKDRRNDGENTRKIVQPEHFHSAPPNQMANRREEINCNSYILPPHFVRQMARQTASVGYADSSPIEINQLAAMSPICGLPINWKWRYYDDDISSWWLQVVTGS